MIKAKLISGQRYIYWNYLGGITSNVRINEFPRSGGTWLSKMLAELLALPFPQNSFIPVERCIEHAHYKGPFNDKTIYVIRDGRDVMTSAFFHFLTYRKNKPKHLVDKWRRIVGYSNESEPELFMASFISKFSKNFTIGGRTTSWSEHVSSFEKNDSKVLVIKYEKMLQSCEEVLIDACQFLEIEPQKEIVDIVNNNSFEKLAKRKRGVEVENHFYRKGISGDWQNYFNDEALNAFSNLHGEALREWGYD